ncbi:hypothetical protein J1N35_010366 [Gossypium stocksii]|uniref:Uncharacterized protein n=1 Tax=Gossypium stocksii TaxID=47602 RepID=A0A9D3W1Q0_9ROSI|nr:hypothetical protein J1N35_010366 [Gossypium stocksii]
MPSKILRAQPVDLAFNFSIKLCELRTRIRRKVRGSSRGKFSSLKCRYPVLLDPFKYKLFDVKDEIELEAIVDLHYLSGNAILELYIEFVEVDRVGQSSANIPTNVETKVEVENPMTWFCGGFIAFLQRSHYDVPESSMRRQFSVLCIDYNFGGQSIHQLGYLDNLNLNTRVQYSLSAFNFNSDIIANIILLMVKASLRIPLPLLVANIRS